jgi:hypothetical protein
MGLAVASDLDRARVLRRRGRERRRVHRPGSLHAYRRSYKRDRNARHQHETTRAAATTKSRSSAEFSGLCDMNFSHPHLLLARTYSHQTVARPRAAA